MYKTLHLNYTFILNLWRFLIPLRKLGGGVYTTMKSILAISIMAVLATAAVVPGLQDAFAAKANTSEKLSPKAFGEKTKFAKCSGDVCFIKSQPFGFSDHPSKHSKNMWAEQRLQNMMETFNQKLTTSMKFK